MEAIITRAVPAAGKSTWARQFIKDNPTYKRISRDDLRVMLWNNDYNQPNRNKNEQFVTDIVDMIIYESSMTGFNLVIDQTSLNVKDHARLRASLKNCGYTVVDQWFDVPFEECCRRNNSRSGWEKVPQTVMDSMWANYLKIRGSSHLPT